jgi:hypothetical protein
MRHATHPTIRTNRILRGRWALGLQSAGADLERRVSSYRTGIFRLPSKIDEMDPSGFCHIGPDALYDGTMREIGTSRRS